MRREVLLSLSLWGALHHLRLLAGSCKMQAAAHAGTIFQHACIIAPDFIERLLRGLTALQTAMRVWDTLLSRCMQGLGILISIIRGLLTADGHANCIRGLGIKTSMLRGLLTADGHAGVGCPAERAVMRELGC